MELEYAAKQLEALGNPTRLAIYRYLVKNGNSGSTVGDIRDSLGVPASTFSHHISKLVNIGLLSRERDGRTLICWAVHSSMDELMEYLVNNCCNEEWYIQPDE